MNTIMLTIRRIRNRTPEEEQDLMEARRMQRIDMGASHEFGAGIQTDLLHVAITEEQFEMIRKAVLEIF